MGVSGVIVLTLRRYARDKVSLGMPVTGVGMVGAWVPVPVSGTGQDVTRLHGNDNVTRLIASILVEALDAPAADQTIYGASCP